MSKRLSDIPTSCPMFDKAISILENLNLDEEVYESIKNDINTVIDYINEGRSVNGDLRDTCLDIAEEKDKEIDSLYKEIDELKEEVKSLSD
jgi:Asp-tRNA(Asn)/Glu-tRNA(Gln) amidotransferase C subunit